MFVQHHFNHSVYLNLLVFLCHAKSKCERMRAALLQLADIAQGQPSQ